MRPSSPPVRSESCDARIRNAEATASVIIAKKIVRTRRLNRPIRTASTSAIARPAKTPTATASQPAPMRVRAIATP